MTALHFAAESGPLEVVKWFVEEQNADVDETCDENWNAMDHAARYGQLEVLKWLIHRKDDAETRAEYRDSAFRCAVLGQHWDVMLWLAGQGVSVYEKGAAVCHALRTGDFKVAKWLVEKEGVDVNTTTFYGGVPLHCAASGRSVSNGFAEMFNWLIDEAKANVNIRDCNGCTALHFTAIYGRLENAKWLVERGLDVDAKDHRGQTAFHYAANHGELALVRWFVEDKGVDVQAPDGVGATALHYAARNARSEIVDWLTLRKGVDVNARDNSGATVLHYLAREKSMDGSIEGLIRLLVTRGVDVHTKDNSGGTALDVGVCPELRAMIKVIIIFFAHLTLLDSFLKQFCTAAPKPRRVTEITASDWPPRRVI